MGVTNSKVQNTFLRNNGDDGLAMWAEKTPNVKNQFVHNTVGCTILANNVAIYGGTDIVVSDNLLYDTLTNGGGVHVSNRYPDVKGPSAVLGTLECFRNTLLRCGNSDYNWNFGVGAMWYMGGNEPLTKAKIHVKDCDIIDSSYAAFHAIEGDLSGVTWENVLINGTGTFALQLQSKVEATFINVKALNIAINPIHNCGSQFNITAVGAKEGWWTDKPYCSGPSGEWPPAIWKWNW